MKKLILLCGFVFSMTAIFAQAKTETTTETKVATKAITETATTPTYKNSFTGSLLFTGNGMGVSVDYRRRFGTKDELTIGFDKASLGNHNVVFGYRRYFIQKEKFGMSIGLNGSVRNIQLQGGGLALTGLPRLQRGSIQGVIGAYYKTSDRLDLMLETRLVPVFNVFRTNSSRTTKVGLKYKF